MASYRVKSLKLRSAGLVYTQIDGEFSGGLPVSVEIAPASLDCILPRRPILKITAPAATP